MTRRSERPPADARAGTTLHFLAHAGWALGGLLGAVVLLVQGSVAAVRAPNPTDDLSGTLLEVFLGGVVVGAVPGAILGGLVQLVCRAIVGGRRPDRSSRAALGTGRWRRLHRGVRRRRRPVSGHHHRNPTWTAQGVADGDGRTVGVRTRRGAQARGAG